MINRERIARDVIVIGCSAGGIEALTGLLPRLPVSLPAGVAVVIHRPRHVPSVLAKVLGQRSTLPVVEPEDGQPWQPGQVYLAPRDHHLVLGPGHVELTRDPPQHFLRPAVDPLFLSAAAVYGPRVAAVVLSGMGADGVRGCIGVKARRGVTLVQTPDEALFPSMPETALQRDDVDAMLPVEGLAELLDALARGAAVDLDR